MRYYYEYNRLSRYFDIYPDRPNEEERRILSIIKKIEDSINMATIQMERLMEDLSEAQYASEHLRPQSFKRSKPFLKYFSDAAFFINIVNRYFSLIRQLEKIANKVPINAILQPYDSLITTYRLTRNSFEHIDERLIKQDSFIEEISSVSEDILKTKHGKIKLTAESLIPLYSIFEEIIMALDAMIEDRKESIDLFWYKFDQRTKKLWDEKYGPSDFQ